MNPCALLLAAALAAATPTVPPTAAASATPRESSPWPGWFEKNTTVRDKKTYVHVFWNAHDARERFAGAERKSFAVVAAWELVRTLPAPKSGADLVKVDIVFVKERDEYGMPKWDSLERVAHVELSRAKVAGAAADLDPARKAALAEKVEIH
jgi:hypothetical protein